MTKDVILKHLKERLKEHLRLHRQRIAMCHYGSKEQKVYYNGKIDGITTALSVIGDLSSEIGQLSTETKTQCKITASADGRSQIKMELTESQYNFLCDVFNKMNDARETYGPTLTIVKLA